MSLPAKDTYNQNKPSYRGVMHKYAFFASVPCALFLLYSSPSLHVFWPILVYALCLMALFGTSALYHRVDWTPGYRNTMGMLDRGMIYMFIAGSYTPFAMLAMKGTMPIVLLSILWGAVLIGVAINFVWLEAPNWIHSILYTVVSMVCVFALPQLWEALGFWAIFWLLFGGGVHLVGALVYALRSPNPLPKIFGFHEVFHCFVTAAIAIHFGVVINYLL